MNNNDGTSQDNSPQSYPQQPVSHDQLALAANVSPDETVASPGRRVAVSMATAFVALLIAGVGFWALAGNNNPDVAANEGETTEDQNTQEDQSEDADNNEGNADAESVVATSLTFTELENSPGSFSFYQNETVGDVYYVLSTAPGQKTPAEDASEEEWMAAHRPNTLYTFEEGTGWTHTAIGDRFVSDMHVNDGVVYLLSTGSPTTETLSLGSVTGTDVSWSDVDGWENNKAQSLNLLSNDAGMFLLATRWGNADWEVAEATMTAAGYDLAQTQLVDVTFDGISYIEMDPPSPECEALFAEQEALNAKFEDMWEKVQSGEVSAEEEEEFYAQSEDESNSLYEQIESNQCWGADPCWDGHEEYADDEDFECVEPTDIKWSDVGFTPPQDWKAWNGFFQIDGNSVTELDFPASEDSYLWVADSESELLTIMEDGADYDEKEYKPTRWTSVDGVTWNSESVSGDDVWYGETWHEPSVGNVDFRIDWESQEALYDEAFAKGDVEEIEFPEPPLQRRVDGGAWEDYAASQISGNADDKIGEVYGVGFAVFARVYDGEPYNSTPKTYYTTDGQTWVDTGLEGYGYTFGVAEGSAMVTFTVDTNDYGDLEADSDQPTPIVEDDWDESKVTSKMFLVKPTS